MSFRLTLEPLPGGPPPEARLRKALKALLRRYRLRCTGIETIGPQPAAGAPGKAS